MSLGYGFGANIGQTSTIFTTSGGQSGSGFTGVTAGFSDHNIRLITSIGAAPGSEFNNNCCGFQNNQLGSIVIIPSNKAAAFVHNTIGSWY